MEEEVTVGAWHHSPLHLFAPDTFYMITASTLHKQHIFNTADKLRDLQDILFETIQSYRWHLQAWALFANHYHFIAHSPQDGPSLKRLIQRLHSRSARIVNALDHTPGRQVWFQYWDTYLTYEKSYLARLNYVHNNPVKHGLVDRAEQYPFCSAAWFKANAPDVFQNKLAAIPYDRVNVLDIDC